MSKHAYDIELEGSDGITSVVLDAAKLPGGSLNDGGGALPPPRSRRFAAALPGAHRRCRKRPASKSPANKPKSASAECSSTSPTTAWLDHRGPVGGHQHCEDQAGDGAFVADARFVNLPRGSTRHNSADHPCRLRVAVARGADHCRHRHPRLHLLHRLRAAAFAVNRAHDVRREGVLGGFRRGEEARTRVLLVRHDRRRLRRAARTSRRA